MKKRILLVSDVRGWGGWVRGQYIQKYLSDEFDIDLIDIYEFNEIIDEIPENYDLLYLLFHTMLVKKNVRKVIQKIKTITIVTGFPTIKPIFQRLTFTTFHKHAYYCSAIGANNLLSLADLKKHWKGKTFCATRGVDPAVFYPTNCGPNFSDKFTVAYVGKPVPQKGLESIIRPACERADCKLIINSRNYTNALGPDEMREFYNKADVYVVASTIDGTPNPALEAAACGKPIISNPIGNMPEFIKHKQNGIFINQDISNVVKERMIVQKYAYALMMLKEDREMCFEMGRNARWDIVNNWTWQKVLESERRVFRDILNEQ